MANVRINKFENIPLFANNVNLTNVAGANGQLKIQYVYIPGSLSFNNIAMILSASGTTAKTATISLGFYSLNGATLSLANSASRSTAPTADQLSWVSLVTSATQDITPGNWYLGFMSSTSSNSRMSLLVNARPALNLNTGQQGPFFRGRFSATTSEMPASIATSDMQLEGTTSENAWAGYAYILISA